MPGTFTFILCTNLQTYPPQQYRLVTSDNRGFIGSERLPEVGASGGGTVTHARYDPRGHARRIQDGAHDLAFTFDGAKRLTQVAQADASGNPSTPVLKTLDRDRA
ncbi:MAG: hypothetical protein V1750_02390 [Acidobacteriota bacterium]